MTPLFKDDAGLSNFGFAIPVHGRPSGGPTSLSAYRKNAVGVYRRIHLGVPPARSVRGGSNRPWAIVRHDYPFAFPAAAYRTAPVVIPRMKYFCRNRKAMSAGKAIRLAKAIMESHWVVYIPMN
jgi:hypothetical protein